VENGRIVKSGASRDVINEIVESTLSDRTRVLFRPVRPDDKEHLRRGVEAMSPESRYRRFFAPLDHLSDEQLAYLTEIDYQDHFAWIAFLPDVEGSPGVGVARWIRDPENPESAEAAVTVVDEWQGKGLGSELLVLLTRSAIERGIRQFTLEVLGENEPMMALLHVVGAVIDQRENGVLFLHVPLPQSAAGLDATPSPAILKAAAEGRLQGEVDKRGFRTRFHVRR
jgi:RimJ/RimL family protein N-acetyltransferase